jgi:hypothetical protein
MTVDVEALWANRDQNYRYVPTALTPPATQPPPPALALEAAAPINDSTPAPATTEAVVEAECTAEVPEESVPKKTGNLLDELPAFKAAMESLEERGISIFESGPTKSTTKRRNVKSKRPKLRSKRIVDRKNLRPHAPKRKRIAESARLHTDVATPPKLPKTPAEIDLSRHRRRCSVCHHPDREALEEAFLQWRNVRYIDREFQPEGGITAIYRHARALKLFKQRNLTLRSSLEFVIEQSERIVPSAEGLVKAIRAYTRINESGEWIDTPTTHIVQVVPFPAADLRNQNSMPGLTLNVRKHPSEIIESASAQPLLTGSDPKTEVTENK